MTRRSTQHQVEALRQAMVEAAAADPDVPDQALFGHLLRQAVERFPEAYDVDLDGALRPAPGAPFPSAAALVRFHLATTPAARRQVEAAVARGFPCPWAARPKGTRW